MNHKKSNIVAGSMIVLGIILIALGLFVAPKIMWPPIATGVGFFIIAWGIK